MKNIKDSTKINRFNEILIILNHGLLEREYVIKKTFLAIMSGESIFLLGPPGVAKSLIARRLKFAFKDATSFEYLMNRFSTPEEIFGPISIAKLRDHDLLERKIESYLPTAHIAFLDEIWKAGPSIQNTLLTIINEKIFKNGKQIVKVPLIGLIAASNELPAEGQGLEALWDRFIIRLMVNNVSNKTFFSSLITDTSKIEEIKIDEGVKISSEEYISFQNMISKVNIGEDILNLIYHIKIQLQEYNIKHQEEESEIIYVSDRRWKKIVKVLRTSAFINGRNFVDMMDCYLIGDMVWNTPSQRETINQIIREAMGRFGYSLVFDSKNLKKAIIEFKDEVEDEIKIEKIKIEYEFKSINNGNDYYYEVQLVGGNYNNGNWQQVQYIMNNDNHSNPNWKPENGDNIIVAFKNFRNWTNANITHIKYIDENCLLTINNTIEMKITLGINKKVSYEYRKPHDAVVRDWEKKYKSLHEKLDVQLAAIKQKVNVDLAHIKSNIFIEKIKADVILSNIKNTKKEIHKLKHQVDEIQNYYFGRSKKLGKNKKIKSKTNSTDIDYDEILNYISYLLENCNYNEHPFNELLHWDEKLEDIDYIDNLIYNFEDASEWISDEEVIETIENMVDQFKLIIQNLNR